MSTYFLIESGIRTLLSMFIGGLIGWERETVHRPAGLRTHMLVAVGSCITMQIGTYLSTTLASGTDPTRLGAQVISGMGFLGAGTILKEGATIRGLTTAASLWAVACLGLAVGSGAYTIAIIGFVAVILILTVFEHASTRIPSGKSTRFSISLQCHHTKNMIQHINHSVISICVNVFVCAINSTTCVRVVVGSSIASSCSVNTIINTIV